MIPRYSRPEMAAIWEPANKFRIWFEIEAEARWLENAHEIGVRQTENVRGLDAVRGWDGHQAPLP